MKLQKQVSRRTGEKVYAKWIVTIPEEVVNALNWKQGMELKSEVSGEGLVLSSDESKTKKAVIKKGKEKLSFFERFMVVYDNLPLPERKLPIVVVDDQPISWSRCYSEIKYKTRLGRVIGEKLIKLGII